MVSTANRWGLNKLRAYNPPAMNAAISTPASAARTARLALEDGTVFTGRAFGHAGTSEGEVVFNTSMMGYQEILTDPSYKGQIVTMTYPLIGNYGINRLDVESRQPHVAGFVVKELAPLYSNYRADMCLEDYLKQNRIIGIEGIDTRALTRKLRISGAMRGILSTEDQADAVLVDRARHGAKMAGADWVQAVKPDGPAQQLVAQADAEDGDLVQHGFDGLDGIVENGGVAGTVGDEQAVGVVSENLFGG